MKAKVRCFCCLMLLLCFGFGMTGEAESPEEERVVLSVLSKTAFNNSILHYVRLALDPGDYAGFRIRVYDPTGKQVRFRTRQAVKAGKKASAMSYYRVKDRSRTLEAEILFTSKTEPGLWTIEATGVRGGKEAGVGSVGIVVTEETLPQPADYEEVRAMILPLPGDQKERAGVEAGKIRFVAQLPEDRCFRNYPWKGRVYDLTKKTRDKCSRAVFSMALSWLGIDCTPADMSDMTRTEDVYYTYDAVTKALGNVERVDGELDVLWENHITLGYSPVSLHFTYSGNMHTLLLIGRDSRDPELFYALNPGVGVNAESVGGLKHDHILPVRVEEGVIGGLIQCPLYRTYHGGKIDRISQWRRTGEPGE